MKKALLFLLAAIVFTEAFAQVKKPEYDRKVFKINSSQSISLYLPDSVYYISSNTTNQFDDRAVIRLGKGKQEALQAVIDMIEVGAGSDDRAYKIDKSRFYKSGKGILIYTDGCAGSWGLTSQRLKKAKDAIESDLFE